MTISKVNDGLLWLDVAGVRQSSGVIQTVSVGSVDGSGNVVTSSTGMADPNNSTAVALGGAGVFTGTATDAAKFGSVTVSVFANVASGTNGLQIQQSSDGTNWDIIDSYTTGAMSAGQGVTFSAQVSARYYRVVFTNGAGAQATFRLQSILKPNVNPTSAVRPQDARSNEIDVQEGAAYNSVYNGTTWDRMRGDTSGGYSVSVPSTTAAVGLTVSASAAVTAAQVVKASAGNLYGFNVVAGASAGYIMIFNATSAPADGAVTPVKCLPIAANAGLSLSYSPPLRFSTGITIVFSTTGPFAKLASATAFISGEAS